MSRQRPRRRPGHLRDHRRSGPQDDAALAVPAGAARPARLPVIGVAADDWTRRAPARARPRRRSGDAGETIDDDGLQAPRRAGWTTSAATSATPETYERLAAALGRAHRTRSSTSRSRRRCSRPWSPAWHAAGLLARRPARRGREAVRPRPALGPGAGRRPAPVPRRGPAVPDRPLPGQDGPRGVPLPALRQHDARADLEPQLRRPRSRSRWPRRSASRIAGTSTTRSARCATSSSTTCCSCWPRRRWSRRRAAIPTALKDAKAAVFRSMADRRPGALRPRPVRRLPLDRRRRQATRTPRPTPRCGWRSTTGAGPGCRSSSAPASACRSR